MSGPLAFMAYVGYILRSQTSGSYYVGQTKDLPKRLHRHNRGDMPATRHSRPWELVYTIEFANRSEATQWERQVKARKSRAYIDALIVERSAGH